ncbi:MAG: hypothetical protein Q9218_000637 [Villophora microphyllina]
MAAGKSLASSDSPDAADLDPRAIGFEIADTKPAIAARDTSVAMAERPPKPQPPPKRAQLDEVIRLMKELENLREEKGQAEEMTDMMGQDLQVAQEEMEKRDDKLRKKEAELLSCGKELKNWQQKAQDLTKEVQEEKRLATEMKQSIEMQEVAVASWMENESGKGEELVRLRDQVAHLVASLADKDTEKKETASQTEEELSYLRKQVEELTSSLAKKEDQMKSIGSRTLKELVYLRKQATQLKSTISEKDAELTTKVSLAAGVAYDKWQATIREKQLQFETTLQETEERLNAQLTQEQDLRRAAEATLRDTREGMGVNVNNQEQSRDKQHHSDETTPSKLEESLRLQLTQEQEQRRIVEATLHAAQDQLDLQSSQQDEQELRRGAAEASLQTTKQDYEVRLREASERIAALQTRAQDAEVSMQEHTNRAQQAASMEKEKENLAQRIRGLETEVQDRRKTCDWFKQNSERLSREIKEAEAAERAIEHKEYAAKRQVAALKAQVAALQQMPKV